MRLLRYLFFSIPVFVVGSVILTILEAVTWCFDRSGRWQDRVSRAWCRMVLSAAFIRVRTEGLEKIDPHGSYVFAANHSSYLDTPALLAHLPCHVRFFAYRRLFDIPFFGAHLKVAGHVPVDSSSAWASLGSMAEGVRLVAERGVSVALFPEGRRSAGSLREFRQGAAYIAIKTGVPLVPIGIVGMGRLMPVGSPYMRSGSVHIRIGDPIAASGLTPNDRAALTCRLRAEVARLTDSGTSPQGHFPGADEGADAHRVVQSADPEGHGMNRP
jgi:1-acyl-sn-glycerol-3-phosphate acyltransferase